MVLAKADFNSYYTYYTDYTDYKRLAFQKCSSSHKNANILNITINCDDQKLIGKTNLIHWLYHLDVVFLPMSWESHFECEDNRGISINNTGQWIRYERGIEGGGVMLLSGVCKEQKYRWKK